MNQIQEARLTDALAACNGCEMEDADPTDAAGYGPSCISARRRQATQSAVILSCGQMLAELLNDAEGGPVPNIRDPRWAGYGKTLEDVMVAPPSAKNVTPR